MRWTRATRSSPASSRFLIQGNILRGEVYPLSVAAERTQQALSVIEVARGRSAPRPWRTARPARATTRFASTSRSGSWRPSSRSSRRFATRRSPASSAIAYLEARGLPVPAKASAYSVNAGLWGTTWGGGWTHDTWAGPPAELLDPPASAPAPAELVIGWERGVPSPSMTRPSPAPI